MARSTLQYRADVLDALYPLLLRRGKPECMRSELPVEGAIGSCPMGDGPEFVATARQDLLRKVGIKPIQIYPGSPWENGYNAHFNGTLRWKS